MKIKITPMKYEDVMALTKQQHLKPLKPNMFFRTLMKVLSDMELVTVGYKTRKIGMEKLGSNEPCLYLMNHSSFIDLKIAMSSLYPKPINIVCTTDGFVGKSWLMRQIGCIPTQKFVPDLTLIRDMSYALKTLKCSVLMFPEAGYSFDGTATALPESLGSCIKLLGVPVVMIRTYGAFTRNPLYNNLQLRKVKVSADMEYLLSPEDIASKSAEEINALLKERFTFDSFRWQQENNIAVSEKFRADELNRILYKCPACKCEGCMNGKGTSITCSECGKVYELDEYGSIKAADGVTEFDHIPDWYNWERECVRDEIVSGSYMLDTEVDICMMIDTKKLYGVGSGRLVHDSSGFRLTGCDGKLEYQQKPMASYSLNSDFYWYEIGDVIGIGSRDALYFCFPKNMKDVVAKARLAAEEMYKLTKPGIRRRA
nr:1-acyl-sn-glycerol-3-phosphate acyltransferase [Clostridia bacterium]